MTRLLVDFHHHDLYESHMLVYADRFGWDVFAPYGMAWFDEWIWSFERPVHGDAVARQYLEGIWAGATVEDGIATLWDPHHLGRIIRGITLEAASAMQWDFVMSSVPANAAGFEKFGRNHGAQFLVHVGNQWGDEAWDRKPDAAIITTTSVIPVGVPHVVVHQEFSLADFRYEEPDGFGPIRSFVSCFPETATEYGNFVQLAQEAPEFRWEVYGPYGTAPLDEYAAGNLSTTPMVAEKMRGAGVVWHAKHWSDGFGHIIHNAFASGRPVFGYESYYSDKIAAALWQDGVTSIDVGRRSRTEVIDELRSLRDNSDRYLRMCEASAARFREVVDFRADAEQIARLLGVGVLA